MLNWLKKQLSTAEQPDEKPNIALACSCLLVEIMVADQDIDQVELAVVDQYLIEQFDHTAETAAVIRQQAIQYQQESHDLFQFTQVINDNWQDAEKRLLLIALWKLAYSDNSIDKLEEHMIRRISDLLHLRHSDFINAKLAAQ